MNVVRSAEDIVERYFIVWLTQTAVGMAEIALSVLVEIASPEHG